MTDHLTFQNYQTEGFYDELFDAGGNPRAEAELLVWKINSLSAGELQQHQGSWG